MSTFCQKYPEWCVKYYGDNGYRYNVKNSIQRDNLGLPVRRRKGVVEKKEKGKKDNLVVNEVNRNIATVGKHPDHKNISKVVGQVVSGVRRAYTATAPVYVHSVPPELTNVALAIENPEAFVAKNPNWKMFGKDERLGANVVYNDAKKELWVNFHGFDGRPEWQDNVFKHIMKNDVKKLERHPDFVDNNALVKKLVERANKMGYKTKINGHSYGAYKARYFASKFDKDAELLNAHIMPWNTFPKTKAKINVHTTITDPTDFKHIFPSAPQNENHFYYPGNKKTGGSVLDGHYIKSFDASEKTLSNFSKYMKSVGVLGTLAGGLIVGQAGADIASGKDPTSNASQGLSGMTEAGLVGLNIDPEYKWSDDNPPEVGFDWLAYKTTQPIKNALLDFTPMGRDRQRQDRQIEEAREAGISLGAYLDEGLPISQESADFADRWS